MAAALSGLWKGTAEPQACLNVLRVEAKAGDPTAQWVLGYCLDDGPDFAAGLPNDVKGVQEAVMWYGKAADQGHAGARNILGFCYHCGMGVGRDLEKAVELYRMSAVQGFAAAQHNLGVCYRLGVGVGKDLWKAAEWFREAADQGVTSATDQPRR